MSMELQDFNICYINSGRSLVNVANYNMANIILM